MTDFPLSLPTGRVSYIRTGDFVGDPNLFTGDRSNIFYVGDAISLTFFQFGNPTTYPDAYQVKDYDGNTVSSGAVVTSLQLVGSAGQWGKFSVAAPVGGFLPGPYRVVLTGPLSDAVFGYVYGTGWFTVLRDTAGFPRNPSPDPVAHPGGESRDVVVKAVLGMGTSRLQIGDASLVDPQNPGAGGSDSLLACREGAAQIAAYAPDDPARPWPVLCQFPNGTVDARVLTNFGNVYPKDGTVDGSKVFVASGAGSVSGSKVRIYYPNASTLVETYDNLASGAAAETAINGVSSYVWFFSSGTSAPTTSATAIGNAYKTGVIAAVADLYPRGVTRYEGPANEPALTAQTAFQMKLFKSYVHQGHPDAIATGPTAVTISRLDLWKTFLDACLLYDALPDEISTHMYASQINGDFNHGRATLDRWYDFLAGYGLRDATLWDTESLGFFTLFGGYYYAHNAQFTMLQLLLREQYGFPRELNPTWYDVNHGFWNFPGFFATKSGLMPGASMYRTLAEETWGMRHHHAIDFGSVQANRIFLGSVFKHVSNGTSTAVVQMHSALPGAKVKFTVLGSVPGSFVVCDRFGNLSSVSVVNSTVTIDAKAAPTYLRIPAGTSLTVASVNDWDSTPGVSVSPLGHGTFSGSQPTGALTDNEMLSNWTTTDGFTNSNTALPDTAEVKFNSTISCRRVVITFVAMLQTPQGVQVGPPTDFDVETTADGGQTWTTRRSSLGTNPLSFQTTPSATSDIGTTFEYYDDAQYVFDVDLGGTYSINGVRVVVRDTIYGNAIYAQEIAVISSSQPTPYNSTSYENLVLGESGNMCFWRFGGTPALGGTVTALAGSDGSYTSTAGMTLASVNGPTTDASNAVQVAVSGSNFFQSGFHSNYVTNDNFTIEFWHNCEGNTLGSGTGGLAFQYGNVYWSAGKWALTPTSQPFVARSSVAYGDGSWHHVVVTKNGASSHVYIDGTDVTEAGTNFTFGNSFSGGQFNLSTGTGNIMSFANLAVYNVALSAAQVRNHFYAAFQQFVVPAPDASFNQPAPKVVGTVAAGGQLQCSQGIWSGSPTAFTYQWQNSSNGSTGWSNVAGSTRSDYIIDAADSGYLRCAVTASNCVGTGSSAFSNSVGPLIGVSPPPPRSTVVLLSGPKSTTDDPDNNFSDVDRGWSR